MSCVRWLRNMSWIMSWFGQHPCVCHNHVFAVWHDLTWFGMSLPCAWLQWVMSEFGNLMLKRCHASWDIVNVLNTSMTNDHIMHLHGCMEPFSWHKYWNETRKLFDCLKQSDGAPAVDYAHMAGNLSSSWPSTRTRSWRNLLSARLDGTCRHQWHDRQRHGIQRWLPLWSFCYFCSQIHRALNLENSPLQNVNCQCLSNCSLH